MSPTPAPSVVSLIWERAGMVYGGGSKPSDLYDLVGSNPTAPTDSVLPKDTASPHAWVHEMKSKLVGVRFPAPSGRDKRRVAVLVGGAQWSRQPFMLRSRSSVGRTTDC